ncbi:MAG: glycosyltransferase [Cyanobacteria bacterium P01_G01_bin.54]
MTSVGIVTIGRNEGDRLVRCLSTLRDRLPPATPIVYVDSGSTDDSVAEAERRQVTVLSLDLSIPFTAARSRNTGWQYLVAQHPELEFIQFLDGDCELLPDWLETALAKFSEDDNIAVVCGRRRERFPDATPYNRLAEMEWNTPVGEAEACGGDALIRVAALKAVEGYNPRLICGEEPEMCIRMRAQGWRVFRIGIDMTLHDAAMTRWGQYWQRSVRGGWAVAEGYALYGKKTGYMQKQHTSGWLWGLIVPLISLGAAWPTWGLSLILLLGYGYLGWRIYHYRQQGWGDRPAHARLYAFYTVLSKLPQMVGQAQYWLGRWQGKTATLIEYK